MKFRHVFRLELSYQLRQVAPWLYFAVVFALAFFSIAGNYVYDAREGYFEINAPIVLAVVAAISCVFWLLIGASVAGDAAARDVQTRMFPLTYTSPTTKAEYLGGRFLAALLLNVTILLAIPAGLLIAMYLTGIEADILGPFRPVAYFTAFFYIVLPNAFCATAIQFSLALLSRRAIGSYLGGALLFVASFILGQVLQGQDELENIVDSMSVAPVMTHLSDDWSLLEKNTNLIALEGTFLVNRLLWLGISMGLLAFAWSRFRFNIPFTGSTKKRTSQSAGATDAGWLKWGKTGHLPQAQQIFGFVTLMRQLKLITGKSFIAVAKKPTGLPLLALIAIAAVIAFQGNLKAKGVPLLPRTDQVLHLLAAPLSEPGAFWMMIFLLAIFYAGELVWRERESGMAELSNAAPVSEWVLFLGRFSALSLLLIFALGFLTLAGILAQTAIGGAKVEFGLYIQVLFSFQLIECLLFALLALLVHVVVNQKYVGHLVALLAFGSLVFAPTLGLEHKLLVFGSGPRWSYTNMAGFGSTIGPWLWFKAWWIAWALLLAVVARLLWVRGREVSLKMRLQLARRRFTRTTVWITAIAVGLILMTGSVVFYHTNILNHYATASEISAGRAAYEQQYAKYRDMLQPSLTDVNLHVEIYPKRQEFGIKGTYLLVNKQSVSIDTLFLAIPGDAQTTGLAFNLPVTPVLADQQSGVLIYALQRPLEPGDTLRFDFKVHHQAEGFTNAGANTVVAANFTRIRNYDWLPVIGYQPYCELDEIRLRKKYGLAPRPATASLYNVKARNYAPFAEQVSVTAVVGTADDQVVVAPGTLRKTWKKGDRRYFHYATDAPIRNEYAFFSANYALHEGQWASSQNPGDKVAVQIYYDKGNTENLGRMLQSVKTSLDYYTTQFGPYPHRQLRFVATPGYGGGNHADPMTITAEEGFFLLNTKQDPRGFDLVTAVVAHEVAHQWWGNQLIYASVEGAGLLSESLAWYSAMGMLEEKYGPECLQKLLSFLREEYENPRTKAALPLLQATGWYENYRKGPFALYALSKYIGRERINGALKRLLQTHSPGKLPLATSLDLYQELEAATPDSLRYLLRDLFKRNTFWELEAKHATCKQTKAGTWEVTLKAQARKFVVSETGLEKEVPLSDWIEVGVYAPAKKGDKVGKPLYLRKHFFDANQKTIMVTVPVKPSRVGIDPNYLLVDWDVKDNWMEVGK